MRLPGRLSATTLGDVLGTLHRAQVSGTLELVDPRLGAPDTARLHLADGLVSEIEVQRAAPRLGDLLAGRGVLSVRLANELGRQTSTSEAIGLWLHERHAVSLSTLQAALCEQRRLRLEAVFRIPEAAVRFRAPRPRRRAVALAPLTPPDFLHGRPRKQPRRAVPPASRIGPLGADEALRLLGLSPPVASEDVRRAFRELARACHPDRFPEASLGELAVLRERFARLSAAYHSLID